MYLHRLACGCSLLMLLERIAVSLSDNANKMKIDKRIEAVNALLDFSANSIQAGETATDALAAAINNREDLKTAIVFACKFLKDVNISPS